MMISRKKRNRLFVENGNFPLTEAEPKSWPFQVAKPWLSQRQGFSAFASSFREPSDREKSAAPARATSPTRGTKRRGKKRASDVFDVENAEV